MEKCSQKAFRFFLNQRCIYKSDLVTTLLTWKQIVKFLLINFLVFAPRLPGRTLGSDKLSENKDEVYLVLHGDRLTSAILCHRNTLYRYYCPTKLVQLILRRRTKPRSFQRRRCHGLWTRSYQVIRFQSPLQRQGTLRNEAPIVCDLIFLEKVVVMIWWWLNYR